MLETEMLRLVTATLRTGSMAPAILMTAMGKKPSDLFSSFDDKSKPWALLQVMRIGCADGAMRPKEMQFVLDMTGGQITDVNQGIPVQKTLFLETGVPLPTL